MFVMELGVVVQGMGEPLNNYKAVVEGTRIMTGRCFGLSPTHITISTVRSLLHVPNSHFLSCFQSLCWSQGFRFQTWTLEVGGVKRLSASGLHGK